VYDPDCKFFEDENHKKRFAHPKRDLLSSASRISLHPSPAIVSSNLLTKYKPLPPEKAVIVQAASKIPRGNYSQTPVSTINSVLSRYPRYVVVPPKSAESAFYKTSKHEYKVEVIAKKAGYRGYFDGNTSSMYDILFHFIQFLFF
jgi:hypothetical protein